MSLNHYKSLLAPVYSWMSGGLEHAISKAQSDLDRWRVDQHLPGLAIDLGCGPGAYSICLAKRGFETLAIDNCDEFLDDLREHSHGLSLVCKKADFIFPPNLDSQPRLLICLGDTLPHLSSWGEIEQVLAWAGKSLSPGGRFIATFRNYVSQPVGSQVFIPVRSDSNRILTCHLLFQEQRVVVTDLLYERRNDRWEFSSSQYFKLRLSLAMLVKTLETEGFNVSLESFPTGWEEIQAVRIA